MTYTTYLARARQLRSARELISNDPEYASATALLAVHSAIALNDALLSIWQGKPSKGDNHKAAVAATKRACSLRKLECAGLRHLETLIASKTAVSYGDQPVTHPKAAFLLEAAKRFETWTFRNCKEIVEWERQSPAHVV